MHRHMPQPLLGSPVPFREVRHGQPDDCIHYEPMSARLREMHWTVPAHYHAGLHQFQWLGVGALTGHIDGQPVRAAAPAMLMLAPGAMHGFTYSHDAAGHQVTVPSATLARLLRGLAMAQDWLARSFILCALPQAAADRGAALFEQIAQEFHAHQLGRVHTLLALTTLLAVQLGRMHHQQFQQAQHKGLRDALLQRFLDLLDAHARDQWTVAVYADALGISADHLSRTCRALTGQSALRILHERVLLQARRLLAYTPMPVTRIAEQLGYADPAYFSRFFRRGVGVSPSAYRQLVAQGIRGIT